MGLLISGSLQARPGWRKTDQSVANRSPIGGPVEHDVTRRIWGDGDVVLLVFAGAAAEFALNRAVDWLFFTRALPADPIGRLFSTVRYAQAIAFGGGEGSGEALERIRRAHSAVEASRGRNIPAWAYRAVLYLLIDYSERAYNLLHRGLTPVEQENLFADFRRIGEGLGIPDLPSGYTAWRDDRSAQLERGLAWSGYSSALYRAYRRHLGVWRYRVLLEVQGALVPRKVRRLLELRLPGGGGFLVDSYRFVRRTPLVSLVRHLLLPPPYRAQLSQLYLPPAGRPH
jgi:hypothetical protein